MTRLLNEERKTVAMLTKELATCRQQGLGTGLGTGTGHGQDDGEEKENEGHGGHDDAPPPPPYDYKDQSSPIARRIRDSEEIAMLTAANAQLQQGIQECVVGPITCS